MAIEGTYEFVYVGEVGMGYGLFVVDAHGKTIGSDVFGGIYRGMLTEKEDGKLDCDIRHIVGPGIRLVQGTASQDAPYERAYNHTFPRNFGDGEAQVVSIPPGIVRMHIKRTTDDRADAARNGVSVTVNAQPHSR